MDVNGAAANSTVWKENCKTFCPLSRFHSVTVSRCPEGKYPVNTSQRSRFV